MAEDTMNGVLHQEMMERQQPLQLETDHTIAVVGCGGVGSWVAYLLAQAGIKELYLFDFDTVSLNNLNRLPLITTHIGMTKSEALKEVLQIMRPNCKIHAMGRFTPEIADGLNLGLRGSWVIATTDTLKSRMMVYEWAMESSIKYAEAAAEGEVGSVTDSPADWATEDEENPGYASVPVWIGPCMMAATIVAYHVLHSKPWFNNLSEKNFRVGWDNGGLMLHLKKDNGEEEEEEGDEEE